MNKLMQPFINPFEIYSEKKLFVAGIFALLIVTFISSHNNLLLFGSLKVLNNYKQSYIDSFINLSIVLLSNGLILFIISKLKYAKTRIIDVINVVLIAHIISYILLMMTALPIVQQSLITIELAVLDKGFEAGGLPLKELIVLSVFGILSISLLIYFFYFIVVGMKIAINSKTKSDVVLFVSTVLVLNILIQFINPFIQ